MATFQNGMDVMCIFANLDRYAILAKVRDDGTSNPEKK